MHNVWTIVAIAILSVFLLKGLSDYFGNYLISYVGVSGGDRIRQTVFDKVLRQDAEFFETHSTGRIMSSVMNDIEKIQVATSSMLADWLRQLRRNWTALRPNAERLAPGAGQPDGAANRAGANGPHRRAHRRTTRKAQDNAAELNEILQETISGQQIVKSFGTEQK